MRGQTRSCSIFPLCSASSFHLPYCPIPSRCFHNLCPKHGLFFPNGLTPANCKGKGGSMKKRRSIFTHQRLYRFCVCFHIRFSWFPQVAISSSSAHASAVKIFLSWLKACRQFLFVVFLLSRALLLLFVCFHICWSWTSFPSPSLVGLLIINQSSRPYWYAWNDGMTPFATSPILIIITTFLNVSPLISLSTV